MNQRLDILNNELVIRKMIHDHKSKKEIANALNCKTETLNRYLKIMGIDYKGCTPKSPTAKMSLSEYIKAGHVRNNLLKQKMFEEGVKENKCDCCGVSWWQGQRLVLEVHHKNGDNYDYNLSNIELLCPNCHSITKNYKGAGRKGKTARKYIRQSNYELLNEMRKTIILNSDIDCSKYGWKAQMIRKYPELKITPQKLSVWMEKHMPEFYQNCYQR